MPPLTTNVTNLFFLIITSDKFIAALFGSISGFLAVLVVPWTKWHFKERELKRESRKEKIKSWREGLSKVRNLSDFYKTPLYNELIEYIPETEIKNLLKNDIVEVHTIGNSFSSVLDIDDRVIARFYKAISQIEQKWKII